MTSQRSSRKRGSRIKLVLQLLLSGGFLILLYYWLDWGLLRSAIGAVRLPLFFLSLLFLYVGELVVTARIKVLMRPTALQVPFARLLRINIISRYYAVFLPAGIGHMLARWYKVTGNREGRLDFALVSVFEKLLFVLASALAVLLPLLLVSGGGIEKVRRELLLTVTLVLAGMFLFSLLVLTRRKAAIWFLRVVGLAPAESRIGREVERILDRMGIYFRPSPFVLEALLLTVLMQVVIVVRIGTLVWTVSEELTLLTTTWVSSLVFLLQTLPVTYSGLGVRESAFAYAFQLHALEAEKGALVGFLFLLQILINASVGGILEWTDRGGGK